MRIWLFTEQSYHPAWEGIEGSLRITPPSSVMDPRIVADLYHRYLDELVLGDELGFDIMINEHHASLTCMSAIPAISLAILARQTRKARLLCLGVPVANRPDPLRVAEELSIIDNLSRGRLEFGLVKGSGWELYISNQNPARMMDRYWEAHDLILKAFSTRTGPFSWEGEYFNYRSVNLLPPIYQYPTPPMWMPGASRDSATSATKCGYTLAAFLCGYQAKGTFAAYRDVYRRVHGREAAEDRLAYLGMAVCARNEAEARRRAQKLYSYYATVPRSPPGSFNPPGYSPIEANAQGVLRGAGKPFTALMPDGSPMPSNPSPETLAEAGILFWGTPDRVLKQINRFVDQVGGLGHFLCMGQGGYLDHEETVDSLKLLAQEVYPALHERPLHAAVG
jgi:alkanesulfonate monooxygenase SsuD/methylene tetrahydromethanopterin reductase-like flavin-dependent oxidoreductase (luciferase family)